MNDSLAKQPELETLKKLWKQKLSNEFLLDHLKFYPIFYCYEGLTYSDIKKHYSWPLEMKQGGDLSAVDDLSMLLSSPHDGVALTEEDKVLLRSIIGKHAICDVVRVEHTKTAACFHLPVELFSAVSRESLLKLETAIDYCYLLLEDNKSLELSFDIHYESSSTSYNFLISFCFYVKGNKKVILKSEEVTTDYSDIKLSFDVAVELFHRKVEVYVDSQKTPLEKIADIAIDDGLNNQDSHMDCLPLADYTHYISTVQIVSERDFAHIGNRIKRNRTYLGMLLNALSGFKVEPIATLKVFTLPDTLYLQGVHYACEEDLSALVPYSSFTEKYIKEAISRKF